MDLEETFLKILNWIGFLDTYAICTLEISNDQHFFRRFYGHFLGASRPLINTFYPYLLIKGT